MLGWGQAPELGWNIEFRGFIPLLHLEKSLSLAGGIIYFLSPLPPLEEKHQSFSEKV